MLLFFYKMQLLFFQKTFNLVGIRLQNFLLGKQLPHQFTSFCLFLVDLLGSVPCVHSSRVNQKCGKTELKDPLSALSLQELFLFVSVVSMISPDLVLTMPQKQFFSLAPPPVEQISSNKSYSPSVPCHFSVNIVSIDRETC